MKNIDWNNVQEASEDRLLPGGDVCGILRAEDVPDKEDLRIERPEGTAESEVQ